MHKLMSVLVMTSIGAGILTMVGPQAALPGELYACRLEKEKGKEYSPYQAVNPFYIRFDGRGDCKLVYAMLVKEPTSGEVVIMVFAPTECKKWIIRNEGTAAYKGVNDFSWCQSLDVVSQKGVAEWLSASDKNAKAYGEGVLLSPGETDGRLLYWAGATWAIAE
jgi:hypothetical protein